MHTIPLWLRAPRTGADACHRMRVPGGYESWWFDAEDQSGQTRVIANFSMGAPFARTYLKPYRRYRLRPTANLPPLPREHSQIEFEVIDGKRRFFSSTTTPLDVLDGADDGTGAGAFRFRQLPDETIQLEMDDGTGNSANLIFRTHVISPPRVIDLKTSDGFLHRWILSRPMCEVTGEVRTAANGPNPARVHTFSGRGYHDHRVGTGPLGLSAKRWLWGRVFIEDDRAIVFQLIRPRDGRVDDVQLLHVAGHEVEPVSAEAPQVSFGDRVRTWFVQPISFGEFLRLDRPRMLHYGAAYWMAFDAHITGRKDPAQALCIIAP